MSRGTRVSPPKNGGAAGAQRNRGPRRPRRPRRARGRGPGKLVWAAIIGASSITMLAVGLTGLWMWGHQSASGSGFTAFEVRAAEPLADVSDRLRLEGLLDSPSLFSWYKRLYASSAVLEPGHHWLGRGQTPHGLIQSLARRRGRGTVDVNLPEGWDSFQIARRLAEAGVCGDAAFLLAVHHDPSARSRVGRDSYEGYLYPATYEFSLDSEPGAVVSRLLQEAQARFARVLAGGGSRRGLSDHELVVLASIVQKEAATTDEMPTIASVFFNRLEDPSFRPRRMLQSDPTAAYGCKVSGPPPSCAEFTGQVTPAMLRDPKNPYNTYKHPGLPPSPIGNPSAEALRAVLHAQPSDYYFFVLGPDGRHRFSRTLDDHRRAIGGPRREP